MPKRPIHIDLTAAIENVSYDPVTGIFRWLISKRGHRRCGDIAGSKRGNRWRVKIAQRTYEGGRLAWAIDYGRQPRGEVDHRDGDGLNNRIKNLRECTHFDNCQNRLDRGVRFEPERNKWLARICFNYQQINLGRFVTEREARAAYLAAAKKYRGEFARGI